jgi:protein SCO1
VTGGRPTRRIASRAVGGVLVALLGLLAGCASDDNPGGAAGVVVTESGDAGPYAGIEIDRPYPLPVTTLTGDDGSEVHLPDDLTASVRVFFFGYTQCPDICNTVMSDLALAVARLPDEAADDVQVVLVTSDPARDDPPALRAYLDRFDPDFTGLTGDMDTIVSLSDAMGVAIERGERLPSGGFEVAHGTQVVGYVGDRGVVVWTAGTSPEDIGDDLVQMSLGATAAQEG